MAGGYREGSGRSKSGYYKGVYCGSTYELAYVIYRLDHGLPVKRFDGYIDLAPGKYFPDFLEDENTIIEMKGYWTPSVDVKTQAALRAGYKVILKYREDLQREFSWVEENYNFKNLQELYDGYRPKYQYNCCNCNKSFETDKRKRTVVYYCSKRCSFIGTSTLHREENSKKVSQALRNRKIENGGRASYHRKEKTAMDY